MRRVLMIAYHFPPIQGSSGFLRTLKFVKYLPESGWQPVVLTVAPRAYPARHPDSIPTDAAVQRTFALDAARHLSIAGRYPRLFATPDRWVSWWPAAVLRALWLIRGGDIDAIWSTFPIPTAHLIGLTVARLTKLPWVADFRDPMVEVYYPEDRHTRRAYAWVEGRTAARADALVVTTPGLQELYATRYAQVRSTPPILIPNGYDEDDFAGIEGGARVPADERPFVLLHSGLIYPKERDPANLFQALAQMKREGMFAPMPLHLILRATGRDAEIAQQLRSFGIEDIVALEAAVGHRDALAEMMNVDGLLILQSSLCNRQIPVKLYEYLRSATPILALTDPQGDTARTLYGCGVHTVAPLDNVANIIQALRGFIGGVRAQSIRPVPPERTREFARRAQAAALAQLLSQISNQRRAR